MGNKKLTCKLRHVGDNSNHWLSFNNDNAATASQNFPLLSIFDRELLVFVASETFELFVSSAAFPSAVISSE